MAINVTLRQLEYVVAVADTLGFRKAAERCAVSQPSLSAQVKELEEVLGVAVFERDKRRVIVTPVGETIVARARRVLVEAEDLVAAATRGRDPFEGTFRVGVIPTIAPYYLPEVTDVLSAKYPKLALEFREAKTEDTVKGLREGSLDLGLVALEADLGDLEHAEVFRDRFVVALPAGHPLAKKKRVPEEALGTTSILLLEDGHCLRTQALAVCSQAGAQESGFRATSLATLVQMASAGRGATLLPAIALPVENRRGQLVVRPFTPPGPGRTIALAWRRGSALAVPLRALALSMRAALASAHAVA